MASEVHALVFGFYTAYTLQHMVTATTGTTSRIEAYFDSKTVFDVIAKQGRTNEKLFQIDMSALLESYSSRGLSRIA